ncbi:MAG TPA: hypothetical protein VLA93_20920 [Pyrinomonadaceae bacterium]|nr:hypothetical protein [Pyrinomonadaceae bacterium]
MKIPTIRNSRLAVCLSILLLISPLAQIVSKGQETGPPQAATTPDVSQLMRLEKIDVAGGGELITVHAKLLGVPSETEAEWVPLVSILKDTLGDQNPENDRLRYVWPLTYTRPTIKQRVAAAIPFFYTRIGNKNSVSQKPPPPAFDFAAPENVVWEKIFWTALQNVLLDPYSIAVKASTSTYRRNANDYRKSHIIRAISVLTLYQSLSGQSAFSESEMAEMQARLMLTDKMFGGIVDDANLQKYYEKQSTAIKDSRGHNWELLRQQAEAASLRFEPLLMPDGSATHALVWVAKSDLAKFSGTKYNGRFLNIANPWDDKRLLNWNGFVETRYVDEENRPVERGAPGARAVELIPLALYGLDNPRIPMLLVDFRDGYNPKKREMSRRVLNDVTRNFLSVSKFGNLPYFLGRTVFDFVTGRRGMDINQPSRLQTYAQLKLLLALTDSLDPELRAEVNARLERVSLNPFENDLEAEINLARRQYVALVAYARDPKGLAARIERDRRAELVPLEHGTTAEIGFRLLNVLTFGKYVHREQLADDMVDRLNIARRLDHHTKFLQQVAKAKAEIDVGFNVDEVKRSLQFIADHGTQVSGAAAIAAAKIFARTRDEEIRRACLDSLSRISNPKAKNELVRISQNTEFEKRWRDLAALYIERPNEQGPSITASSSSGSPMKAGQPE